MSPETSGNNPPSVVRRKKNIKKKVNQNGDDCFELDSTTTHCDYFPIPSSHAYYLNLPNQVPSCSSMTNGHNRQHLMSLSNHSLNCGSCLSNMNTFKNHIPDFSEDIEFSSLPVVHMGPDEAATKRRFSDPGIPNDSDSSVNSADDGILHKLKSQINSLKESNHRLSKEIMDLKIEVNILKQQSNFKHHDREYEPGILADVIREVRDAARVREDAFLAKVKHLLEEQQQRLGLNHMHYLSDKHKNNERISKLEEQLKLLTINNKRQEDKPLNGNVSNTGQVMELEREAIELRRELQDTRAKKEASEYKLLQLEKELSNLIRNGNMTISDASDDTKSASIESLSNSVITNASSVSVSHGNSRITLTGPVTDL
ncbi:uncharacterized protein LOC130446048 [Diorhabda sublineata]|uniref:uncharacterized protein LOC130446048 n=1 Tax=Diorhabda sublineata TaxID=1163346 RepID=UPI0024E15E69|nr:uncharacterized protein LOC130446048 [Diorhabda sublineata]